MLNIRQRQLNLKTYYYLYTGAIDGIEGDRTKGAYERFQIRTGLVQDGIYKSATDTKLIEVIKDIQRKLNEKGFKLSVDGIVGNLTINAIKEFQRQNNLVVDGIVGDKTMYFLNEGASSYKCKYFKDSEFNCPCCGLNLQKDQIKMVADRIREQFGKPATITSGTRCLKHNKEVGGVSNSRHLEGKAIDIVVSGVSGKELLSYCQGIVNSRQARYTYLIVNNAVHIDTN